MTLIADDLPRCASALLDGGEIFSGLAVPYRCLSRPIRVGGRLCREVFEVGAFTTSIISPRRIRLTILHNHDKVVANTYDDTLSVWDSPEGVRCRFCLGDEFEWASVGIQSGRLNRMSFKFVVLPGADDWTPKGGLWSRTIRKAVLNEISIMDRRAAYPQTWLSEDAGFR